MGSRKVVVCELMSLDGVTENPHLFFTQWDEAVDAASAEWIIVQDAVILGRRSYEVWVGFWPGSEIEPFPSFINTVPKYVATSTPLDSEWAHASSIEGGLVDFVRELKNRPGGEIGVHASISVAHTLLGAGMVDELRLVIAPTIAGVGRKVLDRLPQIRLAPIRNVISPNGYLILHYRAIG